ncbi:hypothetical protein P8452_07354 [Trifolium repens]|nr:hypothetical protein P8452_07354 [Trifolium repens]
MEILTSIVGKVVDYTLVPIGRQVSYLIFYKGNFKMLADHVKDLQAARERVSHSAEEERGNGKEIQRDVVNWLEKVDELIETANQLQQDPRRANVRCSTWGFPNLILRHQLSRKAKKIANNVVQVQGKGTFDRVGCLPALDRVASSSSIRGGEMYETRESIKEKIVKALSNPNSRNIGIYGLGGVGKTTLVEEVKQIAKQLKLFNKVVITHVSQNPDFKTIQGEIADLLGLRFDEETIFGRANRLRQRIKMEKSILVILDNIWSMLDLKKVGIPIGNEHNGCKLLMTCRNLDVLLQMDVPMDFTFKLELMSENETWKLFQFMAGDVVKDNNLKDVAIQVAQKCEGLPLRVVTVARAMRNKRDIQSWKDALRKLQCNDHTEMDSLKYLFSYTMVKGLSHLSEIEVCHCNYMKKIVLKDNNSSANNDIDNEKIEFLLLRSLTIEHLETMDDFFSYHSMNSRSKQKYHGLEPDVSAPFFNAQVAFPKLDTLKLSSLLNLNKIWDGNYDSMYNLTSLIVDNCGGLKYLFSSTVVGSFKNLKHLEISNCAMMEEIIAKEGGNSASEEVQFCKLEKIILKDMHNLKTIWHRQFETLKMLQVNNCNKIVVVFPSSMQKTYNKLEMLEVTNCGLVEEIFELSFNGSSSVEDTTHLKEVTIDGLDKLKKIWSEDPQGILGFQNLINVQLNNCASLEYLLPLSVATRCSHVKELHLNECVNMKEIVEEEKESSSVSAAPIFEFNQLNTLLLKNLIRLKGFFAKKHTLACPSLKIIDVIHCPKLTLYRTISTRSSNIQDDKLSVSTLQPVFVVEEVIPNLEKLRINHKEANMIMQAQNSSGQFTKMTFLCLYGYVDEDTFPYWFLQNVRGLEKLVIEQSCFKKIFQDEGRMSEKTHTQIKELTLNSLPNLEHICDEGFRIDPVLEFLECLRVDSCPSLINLLPSSITFTHLLSLVIKDCNGLTKLITSSTAQSLVKLTILKIKACNSLEEIILGEENVHITFISLQVLMLECLPSLNQFCSSKCFFKFPLLEYVIVRECPRMKVFSEGYLSTPNLRKVNIAENDEQWFWKGNLNDTIKNMFEDKVAFGKFKYLALSDYPEMKDLWYGQLDNQNVFCNLKHLVVNRCDFLSHVLFPSNVMQVLYGLEELEVTDCDSLEAVFDVKDLENLEMLEIKSCGVEQIVAMEEGSIEHSFNFPQLNKLELGHLTNLTSFYHGKHSLDCPSLKVLDVYGCAFNHLDLFSIEKLSRNLEELTINGTDLLEILNQENIFQNVQTLNLQCFDETPTTFLNEYFHTIFPNLDTFEVCNSSFGTLFPTTGYLNMQISKQIKTEAF